MKVSKIDPIDTIDLNDSEIHDTEKIECWYVDGTFAVCPDLFYQLYTINGIINGKNLPLVYGLLPGKSEEIYLKFFNLIEPFIMRPKFIMSDFEKAELNALKTTFKDIKR